MAYFVRIKGRVVGPFDKSQLLEMKSKGKIAHVTEISEDKINWQVAEMFLSPQKSAHETKNIRHAPPIDPVLPSPVVTESVVDATPPPPQQQQQQQRGANIEAKKVLLAKASFIGDAYRTSGFEGSRAIFNFATFGNMELAQSLSKAATGLWNAPKRELTEARDALERVRNTIGRAQATIAQGAFFENWTWDQLQWTYDQPDAQHDVTKLSDGKSSVTLRIPVEFNGTRFRNLEVEYTEIQFSMPDITVTNIRYDGALPGIYISMSGNTESIAAIVNNQDNYQVRVWFTNLRSTTKPPVPDKVQFVSGQPNNHARPSADVLGIRFVPVGQ